MFLGISRRGATAIAGLGLAAGLIASCSPSRMIEARDLLDDFAAGPGPSGLKRETPAPIRQAVGFEVDGRRRLGDLYRSGQAPAEDDGRAALVVVPGVSPDGRDDPRLVDFARTLARVRFDVLVPDIPNLRRLRVGPGDAEPIADAVRAITDDAKLPDTGTQHRRTGLVALSYAAGPAVLAALRPELRRRLAFVLLIGGYYDIEAVVTYFTTGLYREGPDAPWRRGQPEPNAKWVFLESNLSLVENPADRAALAAIARLKRRNPGVDIAALRSGLGPEGRGIIDLLTNRDPDAVPALMAGLPPRILADMYGLDLSRRDLAALDTELILIHGRDDPVIPYTESLALAGAATRADTSLTLLDRLPHVDLTEPGPEDAIRLWAAAYRLLSERDRSIEPE